MEDCVGDVKGLHSKIERKRNVEQANQEAVEKFQQVCSMQMEWVYHNKVAFIIAVNVTILLVIRVL